MRGGRRTADPSLAVAIEHGTPLSRTGTALAAAGGLLLLAAPFLLGPFQINTMSRMLSFGLLALSATLLTGVTGLPTLGQSAYFGVGAYTAAIVAREVTALGPVQLLAAAVVSGVVALLTGTLAARARGVPFLMITLALGELAHGGATTWDVITGGSDGLSGIPPVVAFPGTTALTGDGLTYYYVLAVAVVVYLASRGLVRSPFGLVLRGVRDNERRLRAVGYPTGRYVLAAYTVAGVLAGLGGGLLVSVQRFMSPGNMGFSVAATALLAAIIGGVGSLPGAMLGAVLVVLVRDYIGQQLGGSGPLLVGAMFVAVVYLLPGGLAGLGRTLGVGVGRERSA